jgi:hypothetical protein
MGRRTDVAVLRVATYVEVLTTWLDLSISDLFRWTGSQKKTRTECQGAPTLLSSRLSW